jgi:uncharacterized cupin superfamily protein
MNAARWQEQRGTSEMNKIEHIVQSASTTQLVDGSVMPTALAGTSPRTRAMPLPIPGIERVETGLWECSPGSWRRATPNAEVMHFIAGEGTFTPDGGSPMHIRAGDTVIFPTNTNGVWEVKTTVRKVYVSLAAPMKA